MNREQRRKIEQSARKRGLPKEQALAFAEVMENAAIIRREGVGNTSPAQEIPDGAKVKLNLELIKSRKNYERMSPKYKEFIEADTAEPKEYTAHVESSNLISLVEEPKWLFWSGDLIVCEDGEPYAGDI